MPSPEHLWSGDWERESAAAAAARRAAHPQVDPAAEGAARAPRADPDVPAGRGSDRRRRLSAIDARRWASAAVLVLALAVVAGAAVALLGRGEKTPRTQSAAAQAPSVPRVSPQLIPAPAAPTPSGTGPAWLGLDLGRNASAAGALVDGIVAGGPADAAALRPGDVIVAVDGRPVASPGDVTAVVSALRPGRTVTLRVRRGGQTLTTQVELGTRPNGLNYP